MQGKWRIWTAACLLGRSGLQEVRAQEVELAELISSKHVQPLESPRHNGAQLAQQRVLQQLLSTVRHFNASIAYTEHDAFLALSLSCMGCM